MFIRFCLAVAAILAVLAEPSRGQEQPVSAFLAELWPDAQAKGINRATFDTAMADLSSVWPLQTSLTMYARAQLSTARRLPAAIPSTFPIV